MKGIILAGGKGTRLYPITKLISKQILLIYDKPMIYYPLSVLMNLGIRDILIISTLKDIGLYKELFNSGKQLGLSISYAIQEKPRGIADAFIVGEKFIGSHKVALMLGDNVFYGEKLNDILENVVKRKIGATIFRYYVDNPEGYGVIEYDNKNNVVSIVEKPNIFKSNYVVPGLYFYDNEVVDIAKDLKFSSRRELEITDINNEYLKKGKLNIELLGRGIRWFDTGTYDSLLETSNFIQSIQKKQGLYVSCIEEISYRKGFIDKNQLLVLANLFKGSEYGKYLFDTILCN